MGAAALVVIPVVLGSLAPARAGTPMAIISPDVVSGIDGAADQVTANAILAAPPKHPVRQVTVFKIAVGVDNGWVVYQGGNGAPTGGPTLDFFSTTDTNGNLGAGSSDKLAVNGTGSGGGTVFNFNAGGMVFAPCTKTGTDPKFRMAIECTPSGANGQMGIGVAFGDAFLTGTPTPAAAWTNDYTLNAFMTNQTQSAAHIQGVASDPTNGSFAVGSELNTTTNFQNAIVEQLDSAGQTYRPISKISLGTLGGTTSGAHAISKNALYIAGFAFDGFNQQQAVYAKSTDTAWSVVPLPGSTLTGTYLKSEGMAASNGGWISGTESVKRIVNGKIRIVTIGFVWKVGTPLGKTFEVPGANLIPLKVLDDGRVVGNIELIPAAPLAAGQSQAYHPFIFDGTNVIDLGTMTLASAGGAPAYGCRVERPNNLGELVGSCIPNLNTPYGASPTPPTPTTAFYINAAAASPSFLDANAAIHVLDNASTSGLKPYQIFKITSIDDESEITFLAVRYGSGGTTGTENLASFLASKQGYNP